MKTSIIVPTYNEKENIKLLIEGIAQAFNSQDYEIIVVDDASPDGTAEAAQNLSRIYPVRVIKRKGKLGLSSAVLEGFKNSEGEILGVMDADLSHPPQAIPQFIQPLREGKVDLVIASRYVEGDGILNWSRKRKIISLGAKILARPLTPLKDPLSGFFFLKREVIEDVSLNPKGFKIGLEIIVKGKYKKAVEVPYIFRERRYGKSKLVWGEYKNYLSHLLRLYFFKDTLPYQFFKFCLVGGIGVLVNLTVLYSLVELAYLWYIYAAIAAFIVAVSSNFLLNKIWTFKDERKGIKVIEQYSEFFIVRTIGLLINLAILYFLVQYGNLWYLSAQFLAISLATINNFIGSKYWAFR